MHGTGILLRGESHAGALWGAPPEFSFFLQCSRRSEGDRLLHLHAAKQVRCLCQTASAQSQSTSCCAAQNQTWMRCVPANSRFPCLYTHSH